MGLGKDGKAHMDRHRLLIELGQFIDGLVHRGGQGDSVIAGIELDAAAVLPPQMRLYLSGQVWRGPAARQHSAVQTDAVMEEVWGIVVVLQGQAAVAHNHAVDNP